MRHGTAHLTVALAQIRCHGTTMLKWHQRLDTTKSRTPQKLKMQPENTPLEKGNHIPKNNFFKVPLLHFRGVNYQAL